MNFLGVPYIDKEGWLKLAEKPFVKSISQIGFLNAIPADV